MYGTSLFPQCVLLLGVLFLIKQVKFIIYNGVQKPLLYLKGMGFILSVSLNWGKL